MRNLWLRKILKPLGDRPVEAAVAFALMVSSAVYLSWPLYRTLSVVGRSPLHQLDIFWSVEFVVGGIAVMLGLMLRNAITEALGYIFITGGLATQVIATITVPSPVPIGARLVSIALLIAVGGAFLKRAHSIIWGRKHV